MKVSTPQQFRHSDLPANFLEALNRQFRDVYDVLRRIPDIAQLSGQLFTTDEFGDATVDIKNPLKTNPTGVAVDQVRAEDGSPIVDPWSFSFEMASDVVRLRFVGLIPDTKFTLIVSIK